MRRGVLGISQGASAVAALAATVMIVAIALSAQMPPLFAVQKAAVEQAGEAEKLAGVRLSIVAVLDDGTVILSNDGATPVTLDRLYTPAGITALNTPITIQPGQKVSITAGNAEALAVGLLGGEKVVLKEKPGLQVATATSYTNCCVITRYVLTRSTTLTYTQLSPYVMTATVATMAGSTYSTTTITNILKRCISCYYTTTRSYTSYYYYTPYVAALATSTVAITVSLEVLTSTSTTTSLDTNRAPWTLWYVTHVTYISPSLTTTTVTSSVRATLPTYTVTTTTTTLISLRSHELTSTSVVVRPTATTTTTVTVTHTTAVVS